MSNDSETSNTLNVNGMMIYPMADVCLLSKVLNNIFLKDLSLNCFNK